MSNREFSFLAGPQRCTLRNTAHDYDIEIYRNMLCAAVIIELLAFVLFMPLALVRLVNSV